MNQLLNNTYKILLLSLSIFTCQAMDGSKPEQSHNQIPSQYDQIIKTPQFQDQLENDLKSGKSLSIDPDMLNSTYSSIIWNLNTRQTIKDAYVNLIMPSFTGLPHKIIKKDETFWIPMGFYADIKISDMQRSNSKIPVIGRLGDCLAMIIHFQDTNKQDMLRVIHLNVEAFNTTLKMLTTLNILHITIYGHMENIEISDSQIGERTNFLNQIKQYASKKHTIYNIEFFQNWIKRQNPKIDTNISDYVWRYYLPGAQSAVENVGVIWNPTTHSIELCTTCPVQSKWHENIIKELKEEDNKFSNIK